MNRTDFRWLKFLILMAVASACAADDASAPDSEAGWTIDPEPLLLIRDDDPDDPVPMVEVTSATLLPTDEIVVTDRFGPAIHVFNLDGEVVRSPGQRGEGPGEYLAPSLVTTCGTDSLFVFDYNRASSPPAEPTPSSSSTTTGDSSWSWTSRGRSSGSSGR